MEDVASLVLKVESKQVKGARQDLKSFYQSAFFANDVTNKLNTSSGKYGVTMGKLPSFINPTTIALSAAAAAGTALYKVFKETAALQDYQAQLKTATGSVENAASAFKELEEFAATTPYQLEQSIQAFVKGEGPGLFVFDTCRQFIRTIPPLPRDPKDPDDVDTEAEDHIADEVRYRVLDSKPVYAGEIKINMAM